METDEQKRERQSKALGAAFLAHQVSELEKSVDTLAFSRDPRLYGRGGGRGGRGGRSGAGGGRESKRDVQVVDASALVHALPVLKRWVREDAYQLVVPLSALSSLDLLKKAPEPLHELAREATRFLETQLNIARQIQAAFSPADADERTRLRPQAHGEELSWAEVEKLFVVPEGWVVALPQGVEVPPLAEGEEPVPLPLPAATDIPLHLRSTLQCIMHFYTRTSASSPSAPPAPVAVTYNSDLRTPAPLAAPLAKLVTAAKCEPASPRKRRDPTSAIFHPHPEPKPDFLALSSGDALAYYLETFFPSVRGALATISSAEVQAAKGWLRNMAQARQQGERGAAARGERGGRGGRGGGGRGRGGRGGGTGGGGRGGRGGGKGGGAGPGGDAPRSLFVP